MFEQKQSKSDELVKIQIGPDATQTFWHQQPNNVDIIDHCIKQFAIRSVSLQRSTKSHPGYYVIWKYSWLD